jgi:glucoamylase
MDDAETWRDHVRPEGDYVMSRGPATEQERWEEVAGYSPSTIAAEIAGLICAADIAQKNGASPDAARYRSAADEWSSNLEKWLVTTTGKLRDQSPARKGHYIRISKSGEPNQGATVELPDSATLCLWQRHGKRDAARLTFARC